MAKENFTERDHTNMNAFLGHVLDDFKDGIITKENAISGLAHLIAAVDSQDHDEARNWFEQGRKLIQKKEMLNNSYKTVSATRLSKQVISAAISIITGVLIALLIVGAQAWFKHRNDAPECVSGQPIPKQGCVTTYPSR